MSETLREVVEKGRIIRGYHLDDLRPEYVFKVPVTALTDFAYCPRYAYLRHVLGIKPLLTAITVRALLRHELFKRMLSKEYRLASGFRADYSVYETAGEYFDESIRTLEGMRREFDPMLDSVGLSWSQELSEIKPLLRENSLRWATKLHDFATVNGLEGVCLAKRFVPYRRFDLFFSAPEIGISGARVDVMERNSPVEIKTGRVPYSGVFEVHALQLVWYGLAIEYATGIDVSFGEAYYVGNLERRRLWFNGGLRRRAITMRNEAFEVFSKSEPPPISRCRRRCFLKRHCRAINLKSESAFDNWGSD
ncbi:MAG: CRISPR-associated protein Cas4 [Candidatus Bathyarchaeia archaeon]